MANPEHVAILKQGRLAIHQWHEEHPDQHLDLCGACLQEVDLNLVHLVKADFTGADLTEANFGDTSLWDTILDKCKLYRANILRSDMFNVSFRCSDLSYAQFVGNIMQGADLTEADMLGALFSWGDLENAILRGARLTGTTMHNLNLTNADFSDAVFNNTILANLDLRQPINLDSTHHESPSSIGVDTIFNSEGGISEAFLRCCGIPEKMIFFSRALADHTE